MDDNDIPVIIPYEDLLKSDLSPLYNSINLAFSSSSSSLGLLLVSNLPPRLAEVRIQLTLLSNTFASLAPSIQETYTSESTNFSFGWSHGREIMNGKPDLSKGSFYANHNDELSGRNIWPHPSEVGCAEFKTLFQEGCTILAMIGERVGRACDGALGEGMGEGKKSIERMIRESRGSKGRLLHYFPPEHQIIQLDERVIDDEVGKINDDWCGTHVDHSILTALLPALYLFHPTDSLLEPLIIPSPDPTAGLYIKTRAGRTIKASIPTDCLAFQTGETLSLLSSDRLLATPHFVKTSSILSAAALKVIKTKKETDERWRNVESGTVSRETLALFLQPNEEEVVGAKTGETFAEFTARVLKRHY